MQVQVLYSQRKWCVMTITEICREHNKTAFEHFLLSYLASLQHEPPYNQITSKPVNF